MWVRAVLLLLALCALSSRFVVPAGFMPESGKIALSICSGGSVLIDMGKSQKDSPTGDHAPCSFSASAMPMLSGTPPLLLAGAVLYIFDQAHQPDLPFPAAAPDRLRPLLRGPPSA